MDITTFFLPTKRLTIFGLCCIAAVSSTRSQDIPGFLAHDKQEVHLDFSLEGNFSSGLSVSVLRNPLPPSYSSYKRFPRQLVNQRDTIPRSGSEINLRNSSTWDDLYPPRQRSVATYAASSSGKNARGILSIGLFTSGATLVGVVILKGLFSILTLNLQQENQSDNLLMIGGMGLIAGGVGVRLTIPNN